MKNPIWLRVFFLLVLIQALTIGRSLIWPEQITANLPWPASPLNARFIATLYWMGGISALLSMLAPRYADVRISLIEIGVVTGVLLLLTLPHVGEFTPETFPYRWVILYTLDPLVVGAILWMLRGRDRAPAGRNHYARLFVAYATVLGIAGVVLLVAPTFAAQLLSDVCTGRGARGSRAALGRGLDLSDRQLGHAAIDHRRFALSR